jgi:hypothetical protein
MPPRRHIDHHNSRIHNGASAPPVAPGPMLTIAWLIDSARRAFARMFGSDRAAASPTIVLRSGSKHGYTVLGAAVLPRAVHHSLPANDLSDR